MDEETTTASDSIDLGDATAPQPSDTIDLTETAATSPEPTTTEPTETPEATDTPPADDNAQWLQNKGIDPSDPEAVAKLAQMARNAEKAMHEAKQSKLNEALNQPVQPADQIIEEPLQSGDPRVDQLILERNVERFFAADGDAELAAERKALEPAMAKVVDDNPYYKQMLRAGAMSYEDLAALAKGKDPSYGAKLKQDGGREALETVANKQQGRAVSGLATTSAVSGDTPSDPFLDGFNSI